MKLSVPFFHASFVRVFLASYLVAKFGAIILASEVFPASSVLTIAVYLGYSSREFYLL